MYPTDYEKEERQAREAEKRERQIDKADHDRDRRKDELAERRAAESTTNSRKQL